MREEFEKIYAKGVDHLTAYLEEYHADDWNGEHYIIEKREDGDLTEVKIKPIYKEIAEDCYDIVDWKIN